MNARREEGSCRDAAPQVAWSSDGKEDDSRIRNPVSKIKFEAGHKFAAELLSVDHDA
jgi:hypothetical protein